MCEKVMIRKEDMNKLVMNFLVQEGYTFADKFFEEPGTARILKQYKILNFLVAPSAPSLSLSLSLSLSFPLIIFANGLIVCLSLSLATYSNRKFPTNVSACLLSGQYYLTALRMPLMLLKLRILR